MKKFLSILMLLAILLSCCACGAEETNTTNETASLAATAATEEVQENEPAVKIPTYEEILAQIEAEQEAGKMDPEQLYGSINQLEPVDGVYRSGLL